MTRPGVAVDEVIACPGVGSGAATDHLVRAITTNGGYQAVQVAPERLQFARTFRPTWATVAGFATLPLFLIGIVFFFVKTTEVCVAQIEDDHRGTRLRLTGRLDRDLLGQLRAVFADPTASAAAASAAEAVGAPVASAWEGAERAAVRSQASLAGHGVIGAVPWSDGSAPPVVAEPAPAQLSSSAPAAPAPPAVAPRSQSGERPVLPPPFPGGSASRDVPRPKLDGDERLPDATQAVLRTATPNSGRSQLRLVLTDGREVPRGRLTLVGRDPAPYADEAGAELVAVDDPSVSKTHLGVTANDSSVLVMDRRSTNGSEVVRPDGSASRLHPGEWVELPVGSVVRFGTQSLRVVAGDEVPA